MKAAELGDGEAFIAPRSKKNGASIVKKAFTGGVVILGFAFVVFGIGVLASHFERSFHPEPELLHAEHMVSEAAHELALRADCTEAHGVAVADAMNAKVSGSSGLVTGTSFRPKGTSYTTGTAATTNVETVQTATTASSTAIAWTAFEEAPQNTVSQPVHSVPVSTQTAITTIYSVWSSPTSTIHVTRIRTATTTLPVSESTADACSVKRGTKTVSVYVTVFPESETTVTAEASTVTAVNTDLSLTNGLPDITISARPSTRTALYTDLSLTSGLPDVTVSGSPGTMTDVQTDVSLTSGLPDATVPGNPSTVTNVQVSTSLTSDYAPAVTTVTLTDLWGTKHSSIESIQSMHTVTATTKATTKTTITRTRTSGVTTVTVSNLFAPGQEMSSTSVTAESSDLGEVVTASSSMPVITVTETMTTTVKGRSSATTMTATRVLSGFNTTYTATPYGTATTLSPVIVSEGGKKPEPKGWGAIGGGGGGSLGCTIMLIAVVMFVL